MNFPDNLKYTREHEWIRIEGDEAVIGITDYAQKELGDIVFVDIDTEGETLSVGEKFGTVEAVKTVSDLYMPVAGTILAVNAELEGTPETVNKSPYNDGWMIRIKISQPGDLDNLLTPEDYQAHIES
ncbi:MAG: glycine cleavage system protein GcvH [Bacteroidales bacterium]|jgi:glycine cleavage system H protein|nr:glycine cleavage system protein GcvH [Bacteroidales bacterium]